MDADLDAKGHNRQRSFHWRKLALTAIVTIAATVASLKAGQAQAQDADRLCSLGQTPLIASTVNRLIETKPPCQVPDVTFQTADGKPLNLSAFRGKTVLLNLWATWCPPCVKEMPSLDRLQQKLGSDRFVVVAISQDRGGAGVVVPWLAVNKLTHLTAYLDPQAQASQALQTPGLPVSMVITPDGSEVARLFGKTEWDSPEMIARLRALMEAPKK